MDGVRRPIAALSLVLAVSGCGGSPAADRPLGDASVAWVERFSKWQRQFNRDARRAEVLRFSVLGGRADEPQRFRDAVASLAACAPRFDRDVGDPPETRLLAAARLMRAACREFVRGEQAYVRAMIGNPGEALFDAEVAVGRANQLYLRAEERLATSFAWNRPLPRRGGRTQASRIEPLFSTVASRLAPRAIEVRCWSDGDWERVRREFRASGGGRIDPLGFVSEFSKGRANLAPSICRRLVALAYERLRPVGDLQLSYAEAVEVLAHETEHLVSPGTEAETECYALQDVREAARGLGTSRAYADRLAARYWKESYPLNEASYRTKSCRNGGPLDANPASSRWP